MFSETNLIDYVAKSMLALVARLGLSKGQIENLRIDVLKHDSNNDEKNFGFARFLNLDSKARKQYDSIITLPMLSDTGESA